MGMHQTSILTDYTYQDLLQDFATALSLLYRLLYIQGSGVLLYVVYMYLRDSDKPPTAFSLLDVSTPALFTSLDLLADMGSLQEYTHGTDCAILRFIRYGFMFVELSDIHNGVFGKIGRQCWNGDRSSSYMSSSYSLQRGFS
eukprot:TRINITY_DN145373_c0_g1_i1.p1 TRINITY_DN145373_c0_g1~~TRINITY_DN145373_c0_g1_i1.p1  ORF type:complete len:142 (+),score=1.64 TRINITY_DN145373_c0_g1_i1:102-527(+)